MPKIKRDDNVEITGGDDRGKLGKVLRVIPTKDMVVVEGVNVVFKHLKRSPKHPQGGRIQKEAPIHRSNVRLVEKTEKK